MYQSAFLDSFRSLGESAVQFVSRLTNSLELYLDSRGINKSYDKLVELLISDRYRNTLDEETRHYVADHEHDGWMLPKRMAQLIDLYQSERHPNWNYLKNTKNFTGKTGNTAYKSSSYQNTAGSKHTFIRYDKTMMFCTYCKGKGHLKSSCYKLTRSEKPDNSKKEVKERRCYVCDSKFHLAPKCPEKKQGKTFNTKRVTVDSVSQNFSLPNRSIDNKIFQFNDLLNSMNVTDSMERIVFQPIDIKNDVRVNSVTGVYGFIPSVKNSACVGLNAEVGGIALHDQVEGIDRDELGQLELDDDHIVRHEDGSEVAAGLWGGGLSSGIGRDLNNLFENDVGVNDTDTKSMHTTNMIKHNKEHVVNVVFDGQKIPMLIDSGTQISVIRSKLIPHSIISNDSTNQIHLLGAFGKPVSATVIPIAAVLSDDNSTGLSNRSSKILHIALCDELNGDTGLLSINDFNILCGRSPFISNVKVMSNSERICLDCKKVDVSDMVENDIVSDNDNSNVALGGKFNKDNMFILDLSVESVDAFKNDQLNDSTLISSWKNAGNEGDKEFVINSDNGLLYHKDQLYGVEVFQLVVPETKRKMIMTSSHDSSWSMHFGAIKTIQRIKAYFYWPSIVQDVRKYVSSCEKCQKRARITKFDRVPIQHVEHGNTPFEHVSIDLIGPLEPKSSSGHKYIICLIDYASRWVEALPLKTLTAKEACDALLIMFTRIGIPRILVSDNATNLISGLNKELYTRLGVNLRNSTPLHL